MDPIVGSGSASMMAIRVLLDHDVDEENIILVCLIMATCGIQGIGFILYGIKCRLQTCLTENTFLM